MFKELSRYFEDLGTSSNSIFRKKTNTWKNQYLGEVGTSKSSVLKSPQYLRKAGSQKTSVLEESQHLRKYGTFGQAGI